MTICRVISIEPLDKKWSTQKTRVSKEDEGEKYDGDSIRCMFEERFGRNVCDFPWLRNRRKSDVLVSTTPLKFELQFRHEHQHRCNRFPAVSNADVSGTRHAPRTLRHSCRDIQVPKFARDQTRPVRAANFSYLKSLV